MKTAKELVTHHPGVWDRRHSIILALCRSMDNWGSGFDAAMRADKLVALANKIIELTEQ